MEANRCKLITCILPNDGGDIKLLEALKSEHNIIRSTSLPAKGMAALANTKIRSGELPEPVIVRMVRTIVDVEQADEVFDFIYQTAQIGRPDGGAIYLSDEMSSSPFELPVGVAEEA